MYTESMIVHLAECLAERGSIGIERGSLPSIVEAVRRLFRTAFGAASLRAVSGAAPKPPTPPAAPLATALHPTRTPSRS
jgi:hypothetical protein